MNAVGHTVKAFVIDHENTSTMESDQIDFLQGVIASYMNLEDWQSTPTRAQKKSVKVLKKWSPRQNRNASP